MSNREKTAGETAEKIWRICALKVTAREYAALQAAAHAMNRVSWCSGNTAQSVFREFVAPDLFEPEQLQELILTGIATGEGGECAPEPLHSVRIAELVDSFAREVRA